MRKFILYLWQFPQNFIGWLIIQTQKPKKSTIKIGELELKVYFVPRLFHSAVSLGNYLIFDKRTCLSNNSFLHEYGHQKQSKMLGWLYLPVIGLPSLCINIYSRIFEKTAVWYYSKFPENWADKLGGVKR